MIGREIWMARKAGSTKKAIQGLWQHLVLGPKTTRWHWSVLPPDALYEPRMLFSNTPPVSVVGVDDSRVLVCCTKAQVGRIVESLSTEGGRAVLATQVGLFWEAFFDEWYFCDNPVTIPKLLITTGQMRSYSYLGGETLDVGKALKNIADKFGVEFRIEG